MSTVATQTPATVQPMERSRRGGVGRNRQWWIYSVLIVGLIVAVAPFLWMLLVPSSRTLRSARCRRRGGRRTQRWTTTEACSSASTSALLQRYVVQGIAVTGLKD
jgi:hypothetical protein